jgi:hypothetical protein
MSAIPDARKNPGEGEENDKPDHAAPEAPSNVAPSQIVVCDPE